MNALLIPLCATLLTGTPSAPKAAKPAAAAPAADAHANEKHDGPCHHPETAEGAPANTDGVLTRGEALKGLPKVELASLLRSPANHDGKSIAIEGKVRKACAKKGCWMELSTGDKGPGVRVTFKDYGFFVPLDSAGRTATVEGVVKVADLSEETAKHYEGEGAIVPRGKDGKPREVQLVATAVVLKK